MYDGAPVELVYPSPEDVELAVALATLAAHTPTSDAPDAVCVMCGAGYPCEHVVLARTSSGT